VNGSNNHRHTQAAFEQGFRVSDSGQVVSPNGTTRLPHYCSKKPGQAPYGRVTVRIGDRRHAVSIHQLAAYQLWGDAAFADGIHVRHLNGDSTDNRPENLALGTAVENSMDRPESDRKRQALHAASHRRTLDHGRIQELLTMRRSGASLLQCGKAFGLSKGQVSEIMSGKLYSELTGIPFTPRKAVAA
jgi:hypothetical protein